MKIAFYCPNKPLSSLRPSGDRTIARGLFHFLVHSGHEVREIVQFRSRWFWHSPSGWLEAAENFALATRNTLRYRPDAWLTYHSYYKSPDIIGPFICRMLRIPYFLFEPMYGTKWRKKPETRTGFYMNSLALRTATKVFVNNSDDIEALTRILAPDKITYVAPGIFPEHFTREAKSGQRVRSRLGIPPDMPVVMSAAMFRPGAKLESLSFLFRSMSLLQPEKSRLRLVIVGDGPLRTEVRQMAESLFPQLTIFAGAVHREVMRDYYSAADIFAFPGIRESLGMVYLEAQACGLPIVALRIRGAAQVVNNGRTGILVSREQGEAGFADALGRLLSDNTLRRSLGEGAQEHVFENLNLWTNYRLVTNHLEAEVPRDGVTRPF